MKAKLPALLAILTLLLWPSAVSWAVKGDVPEKKRPSALQKSEAVVGKEVGNYLLMNQHGRQVPFATLTGRPVLINFMYIDCSDICVIMASYFEDFLKVADPEIIKDLVVVSVSIDPVNDTPEKLLEYGKGFTDSFDQWQFVTTINTDTLGKITDDFGYTFERVKDGFDHLNRITLIGGDGVVARHFYGEEFDVKVMEESIKAIQEGRTLSNFLTRNFNTFLLYCSNYDPITKTFKVDYAFLAAVIVNIVLVILTVVFLVKPELLKYIIKPR